MWDFNIKKIFPILHSIFFLYMNLATSRVDVSTYLFHKLKKMIVQNFYFIIIDVKIYSTFVTLWFFLFIKTVFVFCLFFTFFRCIFAVFRDHRLNEIQRKCILLLKQKTLIKTMIPWLWKNSRYAQGLNCKNIACRKGEKLLVIKLTGQYKDWIKSTYDSLHFFLSAQTEYLKDGD